MGIVVSLFRRIVPTTGGHGYQSIPRCEQEDCRKGMPATAKGFNQTAFSHARAKNCTPVLAMLISSYYLINLGSYVSSITHP
jgi:hypothetical protein